MERFLNEKVSNKIRKRAREKFYGDQVLNPFAHPNVVPPKDVEAGQEYFVYYGSGDANKNDTVDWTDYELIKEGTSNDMTDVNGDGKTNSKDEKLLYGYLTDSISYLPAYWKFNIDSTEKKDWFEKTAQIDTTDQIPPGPNWDCDQYAIQFANINESGIEDIANSNLNLDNYDTTLNGRFNLPAYRVTTRASSGTGHRIGGILIGEDSPEFENWYFIEPQNDARVYPGDPSMDKNSYVKIDRYCYTYDEELGYVYGCYPVLNFDLENGVPSLTWSHPDLVEEKPEEYSYLHISGKGPNDTTLLYKPAFEERNPTMKEAGEVKGNADWSSIFYSDSTNQGTKGDSTGHNYNIWRTIWATSDSSRVIDTTYKTNDTRYPCDSAQLIKVRDSENPKITRKHNEYEMFYSEWKENGIKRSKVSDNSDYWDSTYVQTTTQGQDSDSCNYYEFSINDSTYAWDPTGNDTSDVFDVDVILDNHYWNEFPDDWTGYYYEDLTPENTGQAVAKNSAEIEVYESYVDKNSTKDPDSTKCGFYEYEWNREWSGTDSICYQEIGPDIQNLETKKPYSIRLDSFPEDITIARGESKSPDNTGWIYGTDTLLKWYDVKKNWKDSLISANPTDTLWHRHWSMKDICDKSKDFEYQKILRDLTIGKNNLEAKLREDYFSIHPNPASGSIVTFNYELATPAKVAFEFFDLFGKKIKQINLGKKPAGSHSLKNDINGFAPGAYIVYLKVDGIVSDEEKLIIMKDSFLR